MRAFILRRALQAVITLFVFLTVVFFMVRVTGNPAGAVASSDATRADIERIAKGMGWDKPLYVQYGIYLKDILTGSFGRSIYTMRPVREHLVEHTLNSLKLAITAVIIAMIIAVPLGIVAAVKRFTIFESAARVFAVFGMSVPHFWLAIMLIQFIAVKAGLFPAGGMHGPISYILPGLNMSVLMIAGVVRLLRSSMLDVLDSDFVKLARMKGVSQRKVIWKHSLRNALIPVAGFGGVYVAQFLHGSVITEVVFAWPGLGRLVYTALVARDFPLFLGGMTFFVFIAIAVNLMVDIMYSYLDPRIRLK